MKPLKNRFTIAVNEAIDYLQGKVHPITPETIAWTQLEVPAIDIQDHHLKWIKEIMKERGLYDAYRRED